MSQHASKSGRSTAGGSGSRGMWLFVAIGVLALGIVLLLPPPEQDPFPSGTPPVPPMAISPDTNATATRQGDAPIDGPEGRSSATQQPVPFLEFGNRVSATTSPHGFAPAIDRVPSVIYWWNRFPNTLEGQGFKLNRRSNIRRQDYAGPESCQPCHKVNYDRWSEHPHRWMNAVASAQTVRGDFSGEAHIDYLGGRGTFFETNGTFRMRLSRDDYQRTFLVSRTVGSRFFQYYVGVMLDGPEPQDHTLRRLEHLLPFGYWLDQKEWVPVVHITDEKPDGERNDPFDTPSEDPYDANCAACHTTRPMGDWLLSSTSIQRLEFYTPHPMSFLASSYLKENHETLFTPRVVNQTPTMQEFNEVALTVNKLPATRHAVNLGISCEACHLGSREHVENSSETESRVLPQFYPSSPNLLAMGRHATQIWDHNDRNVNWICARCHSGSRPRFAEGMGTWNSTEYTDGVSGACYLTNPDLKSDKPFLTCIHCHNPHKATGQKWALTPKQDDALCIKCHSSYDNEAARLAHTHHPDSSSGARCMNCHMPRMNEGMQDLVRTHKIFSPTSPANLEANQPNACNLCHLEKPIDWTLQHLRDWYKAPPFDESALAANYPDRAGPVGLGWLKSPHEPTRLVAAEALAKANARWALTNLVDMLNDPYLINRQFTQRRLEEMLGTNFRELGYRFYQTPEERKAPLEKIRAKLFSNDE